MSSVSTAPAGGAEPAASPLDKFLGMLGAAYRSPAFWPGVAVALGLTACYWSLYVSLWQLWDSEDGYYSHGYLVPFISAYVIYRWWPKLKDIPVKPGWIAMLFIVGHLVFVRAAFIADIPVMLSVGFIFSILFGIWLAAGFRWMMALSLPVGYLIFAMPVWNYAIDSFTNPLQLLSTKVAFHILQLSGFSPLQETMSTTIYLNNFTLDVGVPCSGFKLVVAVTAFTVFFVLISRLQWWANLIMFAVIIPLCLLINGLRVALIGMVGDRWGHDAGMQFHDYSGYITLVICFFILFKIARGLGWKD
ncbi:MAG TPA: exosortase/archaeosortase family protein [Fimbriimonadaceae bacterium]|nr:exosortase/archaeosortase family protein [Fimbriimonadaceae bacterium]